MNQNIALVGSPNSGKTTLFNWITGYRQKVVNYPGSTVDITLGLLNARVYDVLQAKVQVIDTPGTYSLFPKSPDEEVTVQALFDAQYDIQKVIVVLDATQLARQIHIVKQVQESGFSVVVALTMHDLHIKENSEVDILQLSTMLKAPVCPIDGTLGGGVKELMAATVAASLPSVKPVLLGVWDTKKSRKIYFENEKIAKAVAQKKLDVFSKTEARDRWLLHPVMGFFFFAIIMFLLFSSIYWMAAPLMDQVEALFRLLNDGAKALLGEGLLGQLVSEGLINGLGAVLVFVPQIFILFIGISLLEDSGYLARAATLIDKPMSKLGLNGKAFVPLLSGFACAVPAMMAARSINSKKEKWIVLFILPFMTCSARLPVYALLIAFMFSQNAFLAGALMAIMYLGAIVTGAVAAALLNKFVKIKTPSFFLMELPLYRRPKFRGVFRNSIKRTKAYVFKTAPIILGLSVFLWVLSTFPNYNETDAHKRLESSYAAVVGKKIEPIFTPMGVDWRVGVGLISAFAAREVFVSSMAVMFNVAGAEDDEGVKTGLIAKMRDAQFEDGRQLFTMASVAALLVFFMIALQCVSTSATAFQETGSKLFVAAQLISMNLLAYGASVATYQFILRIAV